LPKFEEEKFKKETHERYFPGNILGETKRDPTAGNGGRDYKMNVGAPELEFLAGPWYDPFLDSPLGSHVNFMTIICLDRKIIEEWLANPAAEKEFILPSFNAYQRRLLYQEIPTKCAFSFSSNGCELPSLFVFFSISLSRDLTVYLSLKLYH